LKGVIRKAIIDEDVFGLKEDNGLTAYASDIPSMSTPGPRRFTFNRTQDKIEAFMDWLQEQQDKGILEVADRPQLGLAVDEAWTNKYIKPAYRKGITRANSELRKAGYDVPSIDDQGGLDAVFNQEFHADRAGVVYTRTFNELKGITQAMDQQISRVLADGLAQGLHPREMASNINDRVDKVGLSRARTLARTETIRAHHVATVQTYRNWGAAGVKVQAEWTTAGDARVCAECAGLEGRVYSIEEIEPMIPAHPNCRCVSIPVDRTKAGQWFSRQ
jgi:SPP1 gp7 family putative phage head morphogenesis protein